MKMGTGGYLQGMQTFCVNKDRPDSTGIPDLSEKIIVDLRDTILLSGDRRVIQKREGISTLTTVRLN